MSTQLNIIGLTHYITTHKVLTNKYGYIRKIIKIGKNNSANSKITLHHDHLVLFKLW